MQGGIDFPLQWSNQNRTYKAITAFSINPYLAILVARCFRVGTDLGYVRAQPLIEVALVGFSTWHAVKTLVNPRNLGGMFF